MFTPFRILITNNKSLIQIGKKLNILHPYVQIYTSINSWAYHIKKDKRTKQKQRYNNIKFITGL
jgi:hypothetical protein